MTSLALVDRNGESAGKLDSRPVGGTFPSTEWAAGQLVRDVYELEIDPAALNGNYRMQLSVKDARTGEVLALSGVPILDLGGLSVAFPRRFDVPAMQTRVDASFSDQAELLGYDVETPSGKGLGGVKRGEELTITLHWRARKRMPESYTVFLHFVDKQGRMVGQSDSPPVSGQRPTSSWAQGEVVSERRVVRVPVDTPVVEAVIKVGLYALTTGQRLSVSTAAGPQPDGQVELKTLAIE